MLRTVGVAARVAARSQHHRLAPRRPLSIFDPKRATEGDVMGEWSEFDALRSDRLISDDLSLFGRMALFHVWRVHLRRSEHFDLREFASGARAAYQQIMDTVNALEREHAAAGGAAPLRADGGGGDAPSSRARLAGMVSPILLEHYAASLARSRLGRDEHGLAQVHTEEVRACALCKAVPFERPRELARAFARHGYDDAALQRPPSPEQGLWLELTMSVAARERVGVLGERPETDVASRGHLNESKVMFFGCVGGPEETAWRVVGRFK